MMGSRTTNQVSQYKFKYFKQHPELKNLRGTEQTDFEGDSCDPPSLSTASSRNEEAPRPILHMPTFNQEYNIQREEDGLAQPNISSPGSTPSDDTLMERLQQLDKDLNSLPGLPLVPDPSDALEVDILHQADHDSSPALPLPITPRDVEPTRPPTLPTPHSFPPPPSPLDLWDVEQERTTPPPLPPPLNQGDREEINRVITACRQITEDTHRQNCTPQFLMINTPRSFNPQQPAVRNNQHPCNNPSQPNDYLKKLHEDTEDELQCYLQEDISAAQSTAFETCINKLSKQLSNLRTPQPQQRHPNGLARL